MCAADPRHGRDLTAAALFLGVEHLLRQLWNRQGTVLLRTTRGQRREAGHEEVESREGDEVYSNLAEIAVELAWEAQASGHTRHGRRHQMVQITISWRRQLERPEANVVQGLVVEQEALVSVLNQL